MIKQLLLVSCLLGAPAFASDKEEIEGDMLEAFIHICLDEYEPNLSICDAYIDGVRDGMFMGVSVLFARSDTSPDHFSRETIAKNAFGICYPGPTPAQDDRKAVRDFIRSEHPKPSTPQGLIGAALATAYPCK